MNEKVKVRLEAFHETLMALYKAGEKMPKVSKGFEREIFIKEKTDHRATFFFISFLLI